ncbi:aldo/keto reductase [Limimaricola sp. AA108-03]|uniref:aldo/keto reductase n=1 Tax=Limimaricola sp. AA108-03 TaxID=3425945 RepID=UPI003D78973E
MTSIPHIGPIPQIGFGTWNRHGDEARKGVLCALETGYRHIDTAEGYDNEEFVGQAIAESGVARDDIFLTTKVAPESFGPGCIRPAVERSLEKLRVDQVDLLLLHYPSINDGYAIEDYIGQFAEVYDTKLTRHIGVSNFTVRHIDRARALLGDRAITTNQVELHPYLRNAPIVEHCRTLGIPLTAYSPLARGAVADDEVLQRIAEEKRATPAQIALAFLLAERHVVIPSSASPERIASNFAAKDIQLSAADLDAIRALDENRRLVDGPWCPTWD